MDKVERVERYLMACDPAISGSRGHDTTFRVACTLLHGFCLSPTEAFRLLKIYNKKCEPPWSDGELRHKILSAAGVGSSKGRGYLLDADIPPLCSSPVPELGSSPIPKWPAADLIMIERVVGDGPGVYDFWESSPVRWWDSESHAEEIIDLLFPGDPLLCCGWSTRNFETRKRSAWRGLLSSMPLITPNPMVSQKRVDQGRQRKPAHTGGNQQAHLSSRRVRLQRSRSQWHGICAPAREVAS